MIEVGALELVQAPQANVGTTISQYQPKRQSTMLKEQSEQESAPAPSQLLCLPSSKRQSPRKQCTSRLI
jgi:hypothetical protein